MTIIRAMYSDISNSHAIKNREPNTIDFYLTLSIVKLKAIEPIQLRLNAIKGQ